MLLLTAVASTSLCAQEKHDVVAMFNADRNEGKVLGISLNTMAPKDLAIVVGVQYLVFGVTICRTKVQLPPAQE